MTPPDIAAIARKLSEAQKRALMCLSAYWQAGPDLPSSAVEHLAHFRAKELVEREFADLGSPATSLAREILTIELGACWHFRLTPLGLSVRDHLLSGKQA